MEFSFTEITLSFSFSVFEGFKKYLHHENENDKREK